jgi:DNA-binding NtrC family response regulator
MQGTATEREPRTFQEEYGILGESVAIQKIVEVIGQVAPTDITVMISGESGVGKDVIARAIHASSSRSKKPLVTVNSGAIPEGLIESELFGHERGSFTGASDQRKGYFELADGGTIFLDEIGEMPLPAQVKLLRILENGEFQRVGSSAARHVNVRVIAATNKNLENEVRHKRFRTDLFFRLRSVNIVVPPLRERPEDIPILFRHFVNEFTRKNGVPFGGITDGAMQVLQEYRWPGNVRELRNAVESVLVMANGKPIEAGDLHGYLKELKPLSDDRLLPVPVNKTVEQAERELILRALLDIKGNIVELRNLLADRSAATEPSGEPFSSPGPVPGGGTDLSLQEMEKRMITEALQRYKGNRRVAARALNISERTLYRKIKEYGVG